MQVVSISPAKSTITSLGFYTYEQLYILIISELTTLSTSYQPFINQWEDKLLA